MIIGCFLTASKGYAFMGREALRLGGDTFQFFSRNPRGSKARVPDPADAETLKEICREHGFGPLLIHAPYTLNPASARPEVRTFARETMLDDMKRLQMLPGNLYNFHPGSHLGQGTDAGIRLIAEILDEVLDAAGNMTILLETMAGKGTEIGGTFEELADIISAVRCSERLGVCLDTCHIHDGGYDIGGSTDAVVQAFDRIIGLDRLKAIHVNDSKNPLGSRKDRHEEIGKGYIGLKGFESIVNHPALRDIPMCLETPCDTEGYAREMKLLRSLQHDL